MNVSAVIPTRGDVNLNPILESLPDEWERVVWDNGAREVRRYRPGSFTAEFRGNVHTGPLQDLAVYGRYAAIEHADGDVIFCQDDDCVLAPESFIQLLDAYEPGSVVCNMPERFRHDFYRDHALVGFGALFDRDLPDFAFGRMIGYGMPDGFVATDAMLQAIVDQFPHFRRTCDVVFTALTPRILVDAPYTDLPWATGDDRMYRSKDHVGERRRMLDLVRRVRDGAVA